MRARGRGRARLGGLVLALGGLVGCSTEPPPNVLLITLDTTRADFLGCYGKESARTPNLDRLAAEGVLFEYAMSAVPVTLPSHSTLFTGTYPQFHGVRDNGTFTLPDASETLAEILADHGYATGAAVGAFPVTREFGLAQGFDFFDDHISILAEDARGLRQEARADLFFDERPATSVNDAILPWLREHAGGPFFAWIHYWDPHHPHIPPPPFNQLYHHDLYQGEIAFADQGLGTVLDALAEQGALDNTWVVVVGDHGEGRGEHNEDTHSLLTYGSTLRVPLIMRPPTRWTEAARGRKVPEQVGTVDVLPTLLELLALEAPESVQGRSLARYFEPGKQPGRRSLYYAETLAPRLSFGWGELRVLFEEPWKYIHGPRPELYNLDEDPGELENLVNEMPERAAEMEAKLRALLDETAGGSAADAVSPADEETRQRLAALGYISAGGADPASVTEELSTEGEAPQDRVVDNSLSSQVKQKLGRGDYPGARSDAIELVAVDPDNAYYRMLLARALLGLGDLESAASALEAAGGFAPLSSAVTVEVARKLFTEGSRERARALIESLVESQESAAARYIHAEMLGEFGDAEGRLEGLVRAVELDADYTPARLSLAIQLASGGQTEEAENHFKALLERRPLDPRAHFNYSVLLLSGGRVEEGTRHLRRAVEVGPRYWKAHLSLLAVHLDLGEREEAERLFERLQAQCRDPRILERAKTLMRPA